MGVQIEDGAGSEFRAKVSSKNRLFTDTVSRQQVEYATLVGNAYNVSTGSMTLTSDGASAVGYFKYNGDYTLIIKEILVILGNSIGGSGNGTITLIKNPTSGTIVSNAVDVAAMSNRDFSSANILNATAYKGAEGNTFTDGSNFAITNRETISTVVEFDAAPIVLRRGNSIGVKYTPPSGNTSQTIVIAGTVFEEQTKII